MEDLINELNAASIGHQQAYDKNAAHHTQTYQVPTLQTSQQQSYANIPLLYQSQSFQNQQYQATPCLSSAYLTPAYSNPALHEQYNDHVISPQAYTTGNYTHRSQGSYSGDQTYLHAGPAYQNRTLPLFDKGKSVDSGTKSRNRGSNDRGRDKGNGRSRTYGRVNLSRSENTQTDIENDDPFYDHVTTFDGNAKVNSYGNEASGANPEAADQATSLSGESVQNSNGLSLGNDFSIDTTYLSPTTYGNATSQQPMMQMNLSPRGAFGLPSGAVDHNALTNRGISGPLDSRYKVHPSSKFSPGSVFKILWSEPAGVSLSELSGEIDLIQDSSHMFYSTIRRWIVVGNDEGNCTCVPILTYLKRGCSKAGSKPRQHGIAYHAGNQPCLLEGEPMLGFAPIQIEMLDAPQETLALESRVNYSKLMTIEHNYKVFFIGRVSPQDFQDIVIPAVDACWNAKNRGTTTSDHYRHLSRGSIER